MRTSLLSIGLAVALASVAGCKKDKKTAEAMTFFVTTPPSKPTAFAAYKKDRRSNSK